MHVHDVGDGYWQTDHLCEARAQPVVDQDSSVLRVVLELDDIVMAVSAAHEMALRAAAHPADVLNCLYWHGVFRSSAGWVPAGSSSGRAVIECLRRIGGCACSRVSRGSWLGCVQRRRAGK